MSYFKIRIVRAQIRRDLRTFSDMVNDMSNIVPICGNLIWLRHQENKYLPERGKKAKME